MHSFRIIAAHKHPQTSSVGEACTAAVETCTAAGNASLADHSVARWAGYLVALWAVCSADSTVGLKAEQ